MLKLSLVVIDITILYISLYISLVIDLKSFEIPDYYLDRHLYAFTILNIIWILVNYIGGIYANEEIRKKFIHFRLLIPTILINSVISVIYFYLFPDLKITPKTNLLVFCASSMLLMLLSRELFKSIYKHVKSVIYYIGRDEIYESNPIFKEMGVKRISVEDLLKVDKVDEIIIDPKIIGLNESLDSVKELLKKKINILDIHSFYEKQTGMIMIDYISEKWFIVNFFKEHKKRFEYIQIYLEKFMSILGLIIISPIFLITSLLILVTMGRPIFYSQKRTGYKDKEFDILKFRTMVNDAEKNGAQWATPNDSRVTWLGRFLRTSRIDELPQLLNVIKGDMKFVGPRPERPEFVKQLQEQITFYSERHLVRPGITGWAQVNYRYGYSEDDSKTKLRYDLYYIKNRSILLDIIIVLRTIKAVISKLGH